MGMRTGMVMHEVARLLALALVVALTAGGDVKGGDVTHHALAAGSRIIAFGGTAGGGVPTPPGPSVFEKVPGPGKRVKMPLSPLGDWQVFSSELSIADGVSWRCRARDSQGREVIVSMGTDMSRWLLPEEKGTIASALSDPTRQAAARLSAHYPGRRRRRHCVRAGGQRAPGSSRAADGAAEAAICRKAVRVGDGRAVRCRPGRP
jgi:hypothetical protein